jgi:hypothetical protein
MNMPRFTADASLYKTSVHYRLATSRAGGIVAPVGHRLLPQLGKNDLDGASCGKASGFGNVICVQCTPGPFPSCKTYVCDKDGLNCNQVRIFTQLQTASLSNVLTVAR